MIWSMFDLLYYVNLSVMLVALMCLPDQACNCNRIPINFFTNHFLLKKSEIFLHTFITINN